MGKKAKEHRKKVAARNQRIKAAEKKMQKEYMKMFEQQMEQLKNKYSGDTETAELKANLNGEELPIQISGIHQVTEND